MSWIFTILGAAAALVGFGALILIHELGHFFALKVCRLPVHAFSIGFGNPFWSRKFRGTEYRLAPIPLGGYVMPENPDEAEARCEAGGPLLKPASPWAQTFVAAAGPAANLLLAFLLFFLISGIWGDPQPAPIVDMLVKGSPAASAELHPGDRVTRVGDRSISTWNDLIEAVQVARDTPTRFEIEREGKAVGVTLIPARDGERFMLGIRPRYVSITPVAWSVALGTALERTKNECFGIFTVLGRLASFSGVGQVAGPLAILHHASETAHGGIVGFLALLAILSVNLAIFNLLPIPPLDGVRLLVCAWEIVFGHPPRESILLPMYQVGAMGLALLFLIVTIKDIGAIFL
ncbi:MAG: M50 family metallopeptidase [Candidatus Ozemobacteraceae bacterium]